VEVKSCGGPGERSIRLGGGYSRNGKAFSSMGGRGGFQLLIDRPCARSHFPHRSWGSPTILGVSPGQESWFLSWRSLIFLIVLTFLILLSYGKMEYDSRGC
jgi:hypothetical protein